MPSLDREPPRKVPVLAAVRLGHAGTPFVAGAIAAGAGALLLALAAAAWWPPWADALLEAGAATTGGVAERAELLEHLPFEPEPVVRLEFSFRDAAGELHEGRSYHPLADLRGIENGGAVTVRYLEDDPQIAVVAGGRRALALGLLWAPAALAAAGLATAAAAAAAARRRTRWLERAVAVDGRVLAVSLTREGRGVLVSYRYDAGAGAVEKSETTRSYGGVFTDEDAPVVVFCDPQDPTRAVAPQLHGVSIRTATLP